MIRALAALLLLLAAPAQAERVPVLGGDYTAELPPDLSPRPDPGPPASRTRTQLARLDAEGRESLGVPRATFLRRIIIGPAAPQPDWPQVFFRHPDAIGAADAELFELVETRGSFVSNGTERPLSLSRPGIDWWGIDPASGLLLGFDAEVPQIRACTRHAAEVICLIRHMDRPAAARQITALPGPRLEPEGLARIAALPRMQEIMAIIASLRPTPGYRACCAP